MSNDFRHFSIFLFGAFFDCLFGDFVIAYIMLKFILAVLVIIIAAIAAPLVSFGKNYNAVCADAAAYFGIDPDEYEIHFTKGKVINASNEEVNGTFNVTFEIDEETEQETLVYVIRVQKSFSRPFTIGVIFHEFAHAYQHKYRDKIDFNGFTREQHAEMLAFDTLWQSGYWWNSVHMLMLHTWHAKPADYLVPKQIWTATLTGANSTPSTSTQR